ncbi:hypothetical protein P7K49_011230 [Saguinus oedipus]|uniref:FAD dependent oxidoreductase domain-containing protein n=1 Tax=Saguinus oedipus TaxID=9490 RepID=A0ABQ9VQ29_SAGOE|nr:hypothetical protein P7K49_011230 [Saguinus oedipus]
MCPRLAEAVLESLLARHHVADAPSGAGICWSVSKDCYCAFKDREISSLKRPFRCLTAPVMKNEKLLRALYALPGGCTGPLLGSAAAETEKDHRNGPKGQSDSSITGLLLLGMKENQELKTIQAILSREGVEHQCLSSEELKQHFPDIQLTRGEVGLLDKFGGVIYADKALRALQDVVGQLGGVVRDGEKVVEINPGLPVMVKTTSRSYQAKGLVITAGPWTNQLLRPLGIELPLQTLRINVCYWRQKVPRSYGVSQAFPCFLALGLSSHHIYGLPTGEYPELMKVSRKTEIRPVDARADWGQVL